MAATAMNVLGWVGLFAILAGFLYRMHRSRRLDPKMELLNKLIHSACDENEPDEKDRFDRG